MSTEQNTQQNITNPISFDRYQRQTSVAQIGEQGQHKLANSHVAIVGLGGLGCPASVFLAGAGIGKLTLIDHDTISLTNLHRQILFREADINLPKAAIAQKSLSALNSDIAITSHVTRLTANNIEALLSDADVIVDASDNFALSYLLSDYCLTHAKPLVSASVMGVTGYVGVYCYSSFSAQACPSMRAVFPNPPPVGQDCNSVGVVGTAPGIMGTLQAQEVIKVILTDAHQLAGRLLSLDLWTYRQSIIDFNGADEPDNFVRILSKKDFAQHGNHSNTNSQQTTQHTIPHKTQHSIARKTPHSTQHQSQHVQDWVIDVRNADEVKQSPKFCHQHLPISDFLLNPQTLNKLPKNKRLIFTCATGPRALMMADKALAVGFDDVAVWL